MRAAMFCKESAEGRRAPVPGPRSSRLGVLAVVVAGLPAQAEAPPHGLTLAEAYALARARSERVQLADQAVADAEVKLTETWTQVAPQATAQGDALVQNEIVLVTEKADGTTTTRFVQRGQQFRASGLLVQPLFRKGFLSDRAAASLGVEAAQADAARARQRLMLDVAGAFIGLLRARQQVQLAQGSVRRAAAQVEASTGRVKAGGALKTALLQANIDLRRAQIQLVAAQRDARQLSASFERHVGIGAPAQLTLPSTPSVPAPGDAFRAARDRTDLVALRRRMRQSLEQEGQVRGRGVWPTLDAQASAGYFYPADLAPFSWRATLVLGLPLFLGGSEYTRVRQQQIQTEIFRLQAEQLARDIAEEVSRTLAAYQAADEAAKLLEQQVRDAQENYALVGAQFKLGAVTFLEVTNAQSALTEAENLRLVAIYDREGAAYQALYATGTLGL